jgi:predicted dehydrogenase
VANVTASRVSLKNERKMRLFQHDAYLSVDFQNKTLGLHRKGDGEMYPGIPEIESEERVFEGGDAILAETEAFLEAVRTGSRPVVSGADGLRALEVAMTITERVGGSR